MTIMKYLFSTLALACALAASPAAAQEAAPEVAAAPIHKEVNAGMAAAITKLANGTSPATDERAAKLKLLAYLEKHKVERNHAAHQHGTAECAKCEKTECESDDCDRPKPRPKCDAGQKC
ncbi:MAG: hypothetical protein CMK08_18190 [Ponticaulis sp.]|jgi:hypothetical protein|nr:hypothetical protein [Ponticaulis sp.]